MAGGGTNLWAGYALCLRYLACRARGRSPGGGRLGQKVSACRSREPVMAGYQKHIPAKPRAAPASAADSLGLSPSADDRDLPRRRGSARLRRSLGLPLRSPAFSPGGSSACAVRGQRPATRFPSRAGLAVGGREMVIAGSMRRSDEGAHSYRVDGAPGQAHRRRLGPDHHARLRRALGLHVERNLAERVDPLTFGERLGHGRRPRPRAARASDQHRARPPPRRETTTASRPPRAPRPRPALAEPLVQPDPHAAPVTGGGGTAGFQDAGLAVLGGAAIVAGLGSIAYRRRITRNR